ncbi:phosphoglucosamine mutase [Thiomicrospira sp. ALE5]|uniref:phosphoglucosamine mutase n=1 Tax=Thiomicrospira sp. ALE5 TaxID=748650 RepID=UPI0008E9BFF9|nr:phosphoglucosamine mutase [Thiomicrospira sp. ALE5]SFR48831.1 phosphoglucosamine mutase [Thiomicrospira sp. ALE5]
MKKRYFGTDGIRSRVGQGLMTPDQVLKLGWATGQVLKQRGASRVLIGKDTRISGYMFESALEAGLIYAGIDVLLLGPMPTPAIAYLTRTFRADLGIVISASHNPHYDNGIKFFDAQGLKVSDELELAIEAAFGQSICHPEQATHLAELGKAQRINDAPGRYIEFCKSTFDGQASLEGLHLVVDCAHGATYHIAPAVFEELGAKVTRIGVEPNGLNINQQCGATHLDKLVETVQVSGADIGIALDGDGDRLMLVTNTGRIVDGDDILYLLARYKYPDHRAVVGTLMTNLGIEQALAAIGKKLHRANVGDRYVMAKLKEQSLLLGAEGSGHILCLDKSSTGDGIIAALQFLSIYCEQGGWGVLLDGLTKFPMRMINVKVSNQYDPESYPPLLQAIAGFEKQYQYEARLLIRASGTEPLVRVMVEGQNADLVDKQARLLANCVEKGFS